MNREKGLFVIFCLLLTIGWMQADRLLKEHFSESKDLEKVISRLERNVQREKLQTALKEKQLDDLRWEIAALDPKYRAPASVSEIDLSRFQLASAKEEFNRKNYIKAQEILTKLIIEYPHARRIAEAYFLLAESYFLSGQQEKCLDVVYNMMTMFPSEEVTGFIMLRMGMILTSRKKYYEAEEVYSAIRTHYPAHQGLNRQVDTLLSEVGELIRRTGG